jgi:DNA-binding NtrC family response regulator
LKESAPEPARKSLSKGSETLLLVDDEEDVRKLMLAVLQSNGYEVLEANTGLTALATYQKNSHKIDLVVTDIVMPQMTGVELGRLLAERAPGLKILFISGYRDNPLVASLGQAPRDFLFKPFTPDALLAKVREVLDAEAEPRA